LLILILAIISTVSVIFKIEIPQMLSFPLYINSLASFLVCLETFSEHSCSHEESPSHQQLIAAFHVMRAKLINSSLISCFLYNLESIISLFFQSMWRVADFLLPLISLSICLFLYICCNPRTLCLKIMRAATSAFCSFCWLLVLFKLLSPRSAKIQKLLSHLLWCFIYTKYNTIICVRSNLNCNADWWLVPTL